MPTTPKTSKAKTSKLTPEQLKNLRANRAVAERCLIACEDEFRKVFNEAYKKGGTDAGNAAAAPAWACVEAVRKIFTEFENPIKAHEFPNDPFFQRG